MTYTLAIGEEPLVFQLCEARIPRPSRPIAAGRNGPSRSRVGCAASIPKFVAVVREQLGAHVDEAGEGHDLAQPAADRPIAF